MGNTWPCCFSGSNTNASCPPADGFTSIVASDSGQPSDTHESSSVHAMESILSLIQQENTTEHIDKLIEIMEGCLSKIKVREEDVSASSGEGLLASATKCASQVVKFVSTEAQKISTKDRISQVEEVATRVLHKIGGTHYIFLGLSLLAYTLQNYLTMKSNESTCIDLLEELINLARQVKDVKEAVPEKIKDVQRATHSIVVEAVTCHRYIAENSRHRYFEAADMESKLAKTKEIIQSLRNSLTLTVTTSTAKDVRDIKSKIAQRPLPCPSELLDFQPEGIEEQRASVETLLDIGGSKQVIAVVITGFGGIGKSTLAASVIQSLDLSEFKFSKVIIDQKKPDKTSHIVQLQSDIIFHITREDLRLQDPQQGQKALQKAMAGNSCFLYIDNVVDKYFIEQLLPTELLPQISSEEKSAKKKSEEQSETHDKKEGSAEKKSEEQRETHDKKERSAEDSQNQMKKIKIRILLTSRSNDIKSVLNIQNIEEHNVKELSDDNSKNVLRRIILQRNEPDNNFDEGKLLDKLAEACRSIPLLLSTFGNHLKDKREKSSYEEAISALKKGTIDQYSRGEEELSEIIMFVYDRMRDKEAQEAFLDICTYFHGWQWNVVADIVDSSTLATLQDKKLVNKNDVNAVIVHDILRLMAAKKSKDTRLMNYEDFLDINDDESKLRSVKGMVLMDPTILATLNTRHLNAMRHSLRVLMLGDWVRVDGPPCYRAFKKLRYLKVGDLKDFPFQDVSKMEKLNYFWNSSKPGMELSQLPASLKYLQHLIPHRDCNEFASLALKNLISLKTFSVQAKRSVRLPEGLKLPASLQGLCLNSCEQLPQTVDHLPALQTLSLDKCDFECLPQGFAQSGQLKYLSLQHCTNIISLPDETFESLSSLTELLLKGCTRLENLPSSLGKLTALQTVDIQECKNLRELPENFGGLESLKTLLLNGCISLGRLPESFGTLPIESLNLESLASLKELPESIGDLSRLKSLTLISCNSLECLPNTFVQLTKLDTLKLENCVQLGALPNNFEKLCSLQNVTLSDCPLLTSLPDGFQALKTLKCMELRYCNSLVSLPACFEMLFCLEELHLKGLFFSSLPDGFEKLKNLKILDLWVCPKFQTLPQDFENLAALQRLLLRWCPLLEGTK